MWHVRLALACVAVIACHGMEKPTAPIPGQIIYRVAWPLQQQFMYAETAGWVPVRGNTGTGLCNSDGSVCVTEEKYGEGDGQYLTFLYDTKNGSLMSGPLAGQFREFNLNDTVVVLKTAISTNQKYGGLQMPYDKVFSNNFSGFGTLLLSIATGKLLFMYGEDPHFSADGSCIVLRVSNDLNVRDVETSALLMRIENATFKQFNYSGTAFAVMQIIDDVAYVGLCNAIFSRQPICLVRGIFDGFSEDGSYMSVTSGTGDLWKAFSPSGTSMSVRQGTFYVTDTSGCERTVTITGERTTTKYDVLTGNIVNQAQF